MGGVSLSTFMLFTTAVLQAITAVLVLLAKRDIKTIEIATNSMKDALVAATAKASLAEGKVEGKAEGKIEGKIEGKALGKAEERAATGKGK